MSGPCARELDARERGRLELRARRLVAALRRVEAGTYGLCADLRGADRPGAPQGHPGG